MTKTIDYSRYRVAEAIVARFRAGESAEEIAGDFGLDADSVGRLVTARDGHGAWMVELIVAAYDRRGTHYPGKPA